VVDGEPRKQIRFSYRHDDRLCRIELHVPDLDVSFAKLRTFLRARNRHTVVIGKLFRSFAYHDKHSM